MNHEGHEGDEGHKGDKWLEEEHVRSARHRMRLPSPLSPHAERVMSETIGCAIRVHQALGPGFLKSIYRKAMCVELAASELSYEAERPITVRYRESDLAGQRVDLIVEGEIILELKAVIKLDEVHRSQVISYLRTTGLKGGLLVNFRVRLLKDGLQRIVLSQ